MSFSYHGIPFSYHQLVNYSKRPSFDRFLSPETKLLSIKLAHELEDRVPGFGENIKIHLSGCPNSRRCSSGGIRFFHWRGCRLDQCDRASNWLSGTRVWCGRRPHAPLRGIPGAREPEETFRLWADRAGDGEVKRALVGADQAENVSG